MSKKLYFNCRMITASNTSSISKLLINAPQNSAFGKVYHNQMGNTPHGGFTQQFSNAVANPKTALFYSSTAVYISKEYEECRV